MPSNGADRSQQRQQLSRWLASLPWVGGVGKRVGRFDVVASCPASKGPAMKEIHGVTFASESAASREVPRCSFCNKEQEQVKKLIAGPAVFICDECVKTCRDIIADDAQSLEAAEMPTGEWVDVFSNSSISGPAVPCALCGMPILLSDGLVVRDRGVLCAGCIGEVEAAVAEKRKAE
jgi:hypothetical protein